MRRTIACLLLQVVRAGSVTQKWHEEEEEETRLLSPAVLVVLIITTTCANNALRATINISLMGGQRRRLERDLNFSSNVVVLNPGTKMMVVVG